MPQDRFFYSGPLIENSIIALNNEEQQHAVRVSRVRVGNQVDIINGAGQKAAAHVITVTKKEVTLQLKDVTSEPPPQFDVILAQAMPRAPRLDTIVEKGTELGMTELWLFPGELGERPEPSEHQQQRIRAIMVAATKQSGRLFLPKLLIKPALKEWTSLPEASFFGDLSPNVPLFVPPPNKQICFFIGPESGFSDTETQQLQNLGAQGVKLHNNILRTDTASLVALTLISGLRPEPRQREQAPSGLPER